MSERYIDLRPTDDPNRFRLTVTEDLSAGATEKRFLFGGVALGAAIEAMEAVCEKPAVWATGQFLSFAPVGHDIEIEVETLVRGNTICHARATGRRDGEAVFTVNGALGQREVPASGQWRAMPDVPAPEDCRTVDHWRGLRGVHSRMDIRLAKGRYGYTVDMPDGDPTKGVQLWMQPKGGLPIDVGVLAIMADHSPSGVGAALNRLAGGNSLDNTLRLHRMVPTDWVLADIKVDGIQGGFAHIRCYLYARTGELIASASQSLFVRLHVKD